MDDKNWIFEGRGVEPDIVVDNSPARAFAGTDEQIREAIVVILEESSTKEKDIPSLPLNKITRGLKKYVDSCI